jgi:hypothetical protein
MEVIYSSETTADFQQITRYYIPGDKTLQNRRCENIISYLNVIYWQVSSRSASQNFYSYGTQAAISVPIRPPAPEVFSILRQI